MGAAELDLIGGHRALDFVNTLAGTAERPTEQLTAYGELVAWSVHARIVTPATGRVLSTLAGRQHAEAAAALAGVLRLRADADAVLRAHLTGDQPPGTSLERIRDAELDALRHATLARQPDAARHYEWTWSEPDELSGPGWLLANDVVDLLRSDRLDRLRLCAECRWLFLDLSRNHSRRWCRSSTGCGARAKMRRYRATHQPRSHT